MPSVMFWKNLFLIVIVTSHLVVTSVEGIPMKKKPIKFVQKPSANTTARRVLAKPKPSTRDPRLLGKLSVVAGLNLPNPATTSPTNRNDFVYEPTQYVTTYNFPPSNWGPYVAAVYEPLPVPSFFEDPFGYLAAVLNPYNWFNNSVITTNIVPTPTTVAPDENQDHVYLIVQDSDNEIPNEERMSFTDKIAVKMRNENIGNQKYTTKFVPFETSTTTRTFTTVPYEKESDSDLLAEETTISGIENIRIDKNFGQDSRQLFRRTTRKPKVTTERNTSPTAPEKETSTPKNVTYTSASNSTLPGTTSTTNPSQTHYPPIVTYPIYNNGYYYGGYPKNVSHIELTTSRKPSIDNRIHNFNDVNQYLQPYQPNYSDFDEPQIEQTFDFFERSEQLPPLPDNYYDRKSEFAFNNMNDTGLNGFKPSFRFPLHF